MMPAKPEEYDDDATRGEGQRPDNVAGQKEAEANGPSDPFERLSRIVANKVQAHLRRKLPLLKIFTSLFVMIVMLCGVLAGIGIVEYGSVYITWCTSTWWFHLWYITP
jgi:hypothetical protein